jgi:hypothetical protein
LHIRHRAVAAQSPSCLTGLSKEFLNSRDRDHRSRDLAQGNAQIQAMTPYREVYDHFRERRSLEWLTAEALQQRYGGSLDYIKKIADYCVYVKLTAVKCEGPYGRQYRASFFTSISGKVVDRTEPKA